MQSVDSSGLGTMVTSPSTPPGAAAEAGAEAGAGRIGGGGRDLLGNGMPGGREYRSEGRTAGGDAHFIMHISYVLNVRHVIKSPLGVRQTR